jgi:hypothetical protein
MPNPQAFARRQLRSFALAGTVPVPTPFPEVGKLSLVPGGLVYGKTREPFQEDVVVIEHLQSNRVLVRRSVLLRDLAAVVFLPIDRDDSWFFGPEIGKELEARSNCNRDDLLLGIAYAREHAPVLMQVEVGMTAAESAEYYPPVVGERTDDHYSLQAGHPGGFDCDTGKPHPAGRLGALDCDTSKPHPAGRLGALDCETGRPHPQVLRPLDCETIKPPQQGAPRSPEQEGGRRRPGRGR